MTAVTATHVRSGRKTGLYFGLQAAKETPVSNFNTGGFEIFGPDASIPISPDKSDEENRNSMMETVGGPNTTEGFNVSYRPQDTLRAYATPTSLQYLLRNHWGSWSSPNFTLKTQINEWATLAWREHSFDYDGKLAKLYDLWIHRLALQIQPPHGHIMVVGDFAAEVSPDPVDLPAAGITYPSLVDRNVFAGATAIWRRDPTGDDVSLRLYELEVLFDQGLQQEWDDCRQLETVIKTGPTLGRVRFKSCVSDETWEVIESSRAGTKERFRLTAAAIDPAKTLTIDLYEMDFKVQELGRVGQNAREFIAEGRPHVSGSNFVSISIA